MIKRFLKKIINLPKKWKNNQEIKSILSPLRTNSSSKLNAMEVALSETLSDMWDEKESSIFSKIEDRRRFLANDTREIDVIDYGAGSPDSKRTREEMERGFPSKMPISNIVGWSKPTFWVIFLHKFYRRLKPISCLELGTCLGISAAYQVSALNLNGMGKFVTLEGSPEIAKLAEETLNSLGLCNFQIAVGPFQRTLKRELEANKPIDFFFNDGHHDHDAVLEYFFMALPNLTPDAVVVFDDISWSDGMKSAWATIESHERVEVSVHLGEIGIVILGDVSKRKQNINIQLAI